MIHLEEKIKPLLAQKKMSIEKLAVLIGTTKQSLHNAFNKNDLRLSQLEKICTVLEVSISYFFSEGLDIEHKYPKSLKPDSESSTITAQLIDEIRSQMLDDIKKITETNRILRQFLEEMEFKNKLIEQKEKQLEQCQEEVKRLKNGGTPVYGQ